MGTERNRHGLSRHIPSDIALQVRRACGFGCVVCGASVTEYEHIKPEFHEATAHEADKIALVCPTCHGNVTRKFWSKEKIANARSAPHCKAAGFSWGGLDLSNSEPLISFAGTRTLECSVPVSLGGHDVLTIKPPEETGAPFRLSAEFTDELGGRSLSIVDNTWSAYDSNWDAEFVGGRIKVASRAGTQCLVLRALPPRGIAIETIQMRVGEYSLVGDEDSFTVSFGGNRITFSDCFAMNARVGFAFGGGAVAVAAF